jgi:hypothetical protein
MNIGIRVGRVIVVIVPSAWLALAEQLASAEPKADGKDKIQQWQKERLEAATAIPDRYLNLWKNGLLTADAVDKLLVANKLVWQARLDLCEGK